MAKRLMVGEPVNVARVKTECVPDIFGELATKSTGGTMAQAGFENER
jgi:xanthosine utilization system XapX-like protein